MESRRQLEKAEIQNSLFLLRRRSMPHLIALLRCITKPTKTKQIKSPDQLGPLLRTTTKNQSTHRKTRTHELIFFFMHEERFFFSTLQIT